MKYDNNLNLGKTIVATVKTVNNVGIYLDVAGAASAVVSTKAFGLGPTREAMLKRVKVGSQIEAIVRAYYPATRQLVLDPSKSTLDFLRADGTKTEYKTIPTGTTWIVDSANLIGLTDVHFATDVLASVKNALEARGDTVMFFLERSTCCWARHNQLTSARSQEFCDFVREAGITIVDEEADHVMLQIARAIPNSIILSGDRFRDFKQTFSEIVATSRVKRVVVTKLQARMLLTVNGLASAITVDTTIPAEDAETDSDYEAEEPCQKKHFGADAFTGVKGIVVRANASLESGKVNIAVRLSETAAHMGDPEAYRCLARCCESDRKRSNKLMKLADKLQKRNLNVVRRKLRQARMVREAA